MSLSKNKEGLLIPLIFFLTGVSLINLLCFNFFSSFSLYLNLMSCLVIIIKNKVIRQNYVFVIYISLIYTLITLFLHDGGFGSILTFIVPLIYLVAISGMKISELSVELVRRVCFFIILIEFCYSFNYYGLFVYSVKGMINPNTVGMFSMYAMLYYAALSKYERLKDKLLFILLFFISCFTMLNCDSRMTLLTLIFGILLMSLKISKANIYGFISILFIVLGVVFPHIYVDLYLKGVNFNILGKNLYTGREIIWANMQESLRDNLFSLLFGFGSKSDFFTNHDLNMHNNYLGIIVNFGIVGFILCFSFILYFIYRSLNHVYDPRRRKLLVVFMSSVLLYGFTETSDLWPTVSLFSFLSLGLSSNNRFNNLYDMKYFFT